MEEKKFTGKGICKYGKATYTGEVVNGKRHGKGIMEFENLDVFNGSWSNDEMDGVGLYKFWDSTLDQFSKKVYNGQFRHGVREGVGMMIYENGDIYNGNWNNNVRDGNGVLVCRDGRFFDGLWSNGKMVKGLYRWSNGDIYDGEFKDGKCNGFGKIYWSKDGSWFEGEFKDDQPYKGLMFSPKENIRFLEIEQGEIVY